MTQELAKAFDGYGIRFLIGETGGVRFVAKELAVILRHSNTSAMVAAHCRDLTERYTLSTAGGPQEVLTVSEADAYRIVCGSRLPAARRFERWVFEDVLPSIRKTGSYQIPQVDTLESRALSVITDLQSLVRTQAAQLAEAKPKVEFVDRFVDATGRYTLQNAGRALSQPPNKWIRELERDGYLFRQGGDLVPHARHVEAGLFEVRTTVVDGRARVQSFVTPKGLDKLARKLTCPPLIVESPGLCQ